MAHSVPARGTCGVNATWAAACSREGIARPPGQQHQQRGEQQVPREWRKHWVVSFKTEFGQQIFRVAVPWPLGPSAPCLLDEFCEECRNNPS